MSNYLKNEFGSDIWQELIEPAMKDIAKCSILSATGIVEGRKNSHELYGYDFMIDTNFQTWLLEINSSPAMDYSTVCLKYLFD